MKIAKLFSFFILALAFVACHKPTNMPQFVCYYYNSEGLLPVSDEMPEMSNPERLAYWQDRFVQYRKEANKHVGRANSKYIGTTSDKFYSTLRGFIIASLSAHLKSTE